MTEKEQELFDLFGFKSTHVNYLINISKKYKYIYFETPKVGCSTIKNTLQKLEVDDESQLPPWVHDKHLSPLLSPLALEKNLTEYLNDEYFKFSFVRNPYTRILSCYLDKIQGIEKDIILPELGFKPTDDISFKEFLLAVKKQSYIEMNVHWLPQSVLLSSKKITLDFIGRQENFNNDLKKVLTKITKNGPDSSQISNERHHAVGANKKLKEYITEDIAKLIQEIYYDDFALYDYYRDPFSTKPLPPVEIGSTSNDYEKDMVSIIIPCYNQEKYLEETVNSAIYQTYSNIEIIIVNDGSTDNSQALAERLQKEHPDMIRIIQQENQGLSEARNVGIRESLSKYILPLDSDDILNKEMVSHAMSAMIKNNADIVYSSIQCFEEKDILWENPFSENKILYQNHPAVSSLYRKKVWEKINGYKQNMKKGYEDWEFWINAFKHNFTFHYIPKILFYYRVKKESMYIEAYKKNIYLRAKVMMNHPELYTRNQIKKAIVTIQEEEELANLYFYHDKNIPKSEKEWINEISQIIKSETLEKKQVLEIFDKKVGLCNIDIFKGHMHITKLYDEMDVSFILFFSPIRYQVPGLYNSVFAWNKNKGIVNAQGSIFPFVSNSIRKDPKRQLLAYEHLVKFQNMQLELKNKELEEKKQTIRLLNQELEQINSKTHTIQNAIEGLIKIPMIKQPIQKYNAYMDFISIYESLNPVILEYENHILFTLKPKMKNVQVAFYLLKNNERIDTQWYSEELSYTLNKKKYGKGKYRIHYFVIDKNEKGPGKASKQEIGYSDYVEIT